MCGRWLVGTTAPPYLVFPLFVFFYFLCCCCCWANGIRKIVPQKRVIWTCWRLFSMCAPVIGRYCVWKIRNECKRRYLTHQILFHSTSTPILHVLYCLFFFFFFVDVVFCVCARHMSSRIFFHSTILLSILHFILSFIRSFYLSLTLSSVDPIACCNHTTWLRSFINGKHK